MVCDRAVEALLDGRQPGLEAGRQVLDVAVQRAEVVVELGGVADEIAGVALAEDDALRRAQLRDPAREHDDPQQRDQRERAGGERGDPGGGRQLVHGPRRARRAGAPRPAITSAGQRVKITV